MTTITIDPLGRESTPGQPEEAMTIIKVIGVGDAGINATEYMIQQGLCCVDFVAANTDSASLNLSSAPVKVMLGTEGLGAGAQPEAGKAAAIQAADAIRIALQGAHMVFIVTGLGGGTGSGAAPVIASLARELGILTVCLASTPFKFEGTLRMQNAQVAVASLREEADAVIVIPDEALMLSMGDDADVDECFAAIDKVKYEIVTGIATLITEQGLVCVDFEDIRTVMQGSRHGVLGLGQATGDNRAAAAADQALSAPTIGTSDLPRAQGVAVVISWRFHGPGRIRMKDINTVMTAVKQAIRGDTHIIFGTVNAGHPGDMLQVMVVACGVDADIAPVKHIAKSATGNERRIDALETLPHDGVYPCEIPSFLRKPTQ